MTVAGQKGIASVSLFQLKCRPLAMAGIAKGLVLFLWFLPGNTILNSLRKQHVILLALRETKMEIRRIGTQASSKGPSDWFTGTVRIDPLFQAPDPALVSCASVTFEPGARTAWHTHPLGQTLVVTAEG